MCACQRSPMSSQALLSGTLRTFQVAACDGQRLGLDCPSGTNISINLVQYGRLASKPGLCGDPSDMFRLNNTNCMDRTALKVVVSECGNKQNCNLHTSPKTFGVDPCPGIPKFVEVLFKCRPTLFRTEVVCEGSRKTISCARGRRIAIYAASFGVTEHRSVRCPQHPGVQVTNCQSSFTSEMMIKQCQGRSSCDLSADAQRFGHPCPDDHNMYLKVTYTCVPGSVLRKDYVIEEKPEGRIQATHAPPNDARAPSGNGRELPSAPRSDKTSVYGPDMQGDISHVRAPPPTPRLAGPTQLPSGGDDCNCTAPMTARQRHVIGFITEWITAYRFVSDNREKFILYLTLSITGGLLLCLLLIVGRLYHQRRRARQQVKARYAETPAHRFTDTISDVDADIDLTPTVLSPGRLSPPYLSSHVGYNGSSRRDREPPDAVRYASSGRGTLRCVEDDDTNPRSLSRADPNVFYYS